MLGFGIIRRIIYLLVILLTITAAVGTTLLFQSKNIIYTDSLSTTQTSDTVEPFPVSVNVITQQISEDPSVDVFFERTLAQNPQSKNNWWNQVAALFSNQTWYQNLASPISRIAVVWPGERKEEVTKNIGDIMRWNEDQRLEFQAIVDIHSPILFEGKYFPGQYVTHRYATPNDIAQLLLEAFDTQISERYTPEVETQVPLTDALIIASLLEREASDFENMREVSGVIWNRLFIDMPLQLDATLQYVKANDPTISSWWPAVRPDDKYLDSPFNTYDHKGLPPAPIANPSAEAVLAALNPIQTDCLYYFHDTDAGYYCSNTYEEHVAKLKTIYGQGR